LQAEERELASEPNAAASRATDPSGPEPSLDAVRRAIGRLETEDLSERMIAGLGAALLKLDGELARASSRPDKVTQALKTAMEAASILRGLALPRLAALIVAGSPDPDPSRASGNPEVLAAADLHGAILAWLLRPGSLVQHRFGRPRPEGGIASKSLTQIGTAIADKVQSFASRMRYELEQPVTPDLKLLCAAVLRLDVLAVIIARAGTSEDLRTIQFLSRGMARSVLRRVTSIVEAFLAASGNSAGTDLTASTDLAADTDLTIVAAQVDDLMVIVGRVLDGTAEEFAEGTKGFLASVGEVVAADFVAAMDKLCRVLLTRATDALSDPATAPVDINRQFDLILKIKTFCSRFDHPDIADRLAGMSDKIVEVTLLTVRLLLVQSTALQQHEPLSEAQRARLRTAFDFAKAMGLERESGPVRLAALLET
jgi:hypothetical protein